MNAVARYNIKITHLAKTWELHADCCAYCGKNFVCNLPASCLLKKQNIAPVKFVTINKTTAR